MPACTENVTELLPAGTSRSGGTLNMELSLYKMTTLPPVPAACVRVTVQLPEFDGVSVVEVHVKLERTPESSRSKFIVLDTLFSVAVTAAFC
jgi:hypothetical protein